MTSDHRRGFALPAVLTVTGVVTLIFLVAITALSSLNAEARSARERSRFLEQSLTAEALIVYIASTEPFNSTSLNAGAPRSHGFEDGPSSPITSALPTTPIRLDGHPYEIEAPGPTGGLVLLSLRDQAGMINLATLTEDQRLRFGQLVGMPENLARNTRPLYEDYVDEDDLETLNGAERARYGQEGPANRALRRPSEFLSILGVRQATSARLWREAREDIAVDQGRPSINVNTASARTLEVLYGVSDQQAQAAVRAREQTPFLSLSDFIAASGANVLDDGEQIFTFPAGRIVYTVQDTRSPWRYRARIVLSPSDLERPFWVDQAEMTEAPGTAMATTDATRFPYTPT